MRDRVEIPDKRDVGRRWVLGTICVIVAGRVFSS
jgi:hypothetical protein